MPRHLTIRPLRTLACALGLLVALAGGTHAGVCAAGMPASTCVAFAAAADLYDESAGPGLASQADINDRVGASFSALVLRPADGQLRGVLADELSEPVAAVVVTVTHRSAQGTVTATALTAPDGTFAVALPRQPGAADVTFAGDEEYAPAQATVGVHVTPAVVRASPRRCARRPVVARAGTLALRFARPRR